MRRFPTLSPVLTHGLVERVRAGHALLFMALAYGAPMPAVTSRAIFDQDEKGIGTSPTETRAVRIMDFRNLAAPIAVILSYTDLASGAAGQAEINPGPVSLKIGVAVAQMPPASAVGREDLAYVLWAISPEGRATNLGEIDMTGTEGKLNTKITAGRYGLIVTAEPYFAVSRPGRAVVLQGDLAPGPGPRVPVSQGRCELLKVSLGTGVIAALGSPSGAEQGPSVLEEARRAIAVAKDAGAQQFSPDTLATAEHLLQLARDQQSHGSPRKDVIDTGSEAVLIAEDARVLAEKRRKVAGEKNMTAGSSQ